MKPQHLLTPFLLLLLVAGVLAACQLVAPFQPAPTRTLTTAFEPLGEVPPSKTPQASPSPTPTASPSPSPVPSPTLTPSPTPVFVFELSPQYDLDLFQPIDLQHNPPLIARSDETVRLAFDLVNTIYCAELQRYCRLEPLLYYTYGDAEAFESVPLTIENVKGMEPLVARLPATDQEGRSLRYYAEFAVPEAGYTLRYPVEGTIDLFATDNFVPIEFPAENPIAPSEEVYDFFWGYGPDKVRRGYYGGGAYIIAPPAIDVAQDGRIALMDPVNERVIIYNPMDEGYTSVPLPFPYRMNADLGFDSNGRLVICDWAGEFVEGTPPIPRCYRLLPDGSVDVTVSVYAKFPAKITKDFQVLDQFDYRLVAPFNLEGEPNTREAQRQKTPYELPLLYVQDEKAGFDWNTIRFADIQEDVAFEFHPPEDFGTLVDFEKTPQGYLMIFGGSEQVRAVWIDPTGNILKDVTLPRGNYTELSSYGNVAVAQDGSLYAMSSTERGIEVLFEGAPLTSIPAPTAGLVIEEHPLRSIGGDEGRTFTPVSGMQEEILNLHRREREQAINPDHPLYPPETMSAILNGKLLTARIDINNVNNYSTAVVQIVQDGNVIFEIPIGELGPLPPVWGFWSYDGHWFLEIAKYIPGSEYTYTKGDVIQDGVSMAERLGYDEIFAFQLLDGKPFFFFFSMDGHIGASYDFQELPIRYDQVSHHGCCSAGAFNPWQAERMVSFFGMREKVWNYVEIGRFDP